MSLQDDLYGKLEQVLDLLILTTKRLNDTAKRFASEQELERLQQSQAEILQQMTFLDEHIKKVVGDDANEEMSERRQKIHEKLLEFQRMNEEFVAHMQDHMRVIQKKKLSVNAQQSIAESDVED
ncbi:MAG: hypothetical protein JSR46_11945 [Verrucomicrobia bacterium]|nr:hypothetical protein [Verrucomicrobiota bacterium]